MKFITEHPNWYKFTKRLPRVTPRYRNEPPQFTGLSAYLGMQQASPELMAAVHYQQLVRTRFDPFMRW